MPKPVFTIPEALYVGRTFDPQQALAADMTGTNGPLQTAIGPNGCACIALSTKGARVGSTLHTSCAPFPTPENVQQQRMASITERAADFSHSARHGSDVSMDAMIVADLDNLPKGWRPGVYVPLLSDHDYFINYANATLVADGPEMRLQVSHS